MSSALRRSSAEISPFSSLARASLMRGGRNRLPTSSARKGAFVLCMCHSRSLICCCTRDAEKAFKHRGIGFQRATGRVVDDRAALQYHNAVGQPQNLLCILLYNNGAGTAGTGDGTECAEQFLD